MEKEWIVSREGGMRGTVDGEDWKGRWYVAPLGPNSSGIRNWEGLHPTRAGALKSAQHLNGDGKAVVLDRDPAEGPA